MSKSASVLLAFLIYSAIFTSCFLLFQSPQIINYGNSSIDILMVQDDFGGSKIITAGTASEDDFSLAQNLQTQNQQISNSNTQDQESSSEPEAAANEVSLNEQDELSLDDLFANINMRAPKKPTKPTSAQKPTTSSQQASRKANSSDLPNQGSSAQVSGLFDKYFGRINAYLKNIWSLITPNYAQISERDFAMLVFKIEASGVLSIPNIPTGSSPIEQAAREFANKVNSEHRNFGPPPGMKEFSGQARLGVKFSASIK